MIEGRLAFIMLGSSDLERSIAFYSELLGFRLSGRFGDFAFFQTGETTLALSAELAAPGTSPASHEYVIGVDSVRGAHAALEDRIAFLNEPRVVNGENWAVNFRDPDGHLLSFYGPQ